MKKLSLLLLISLTSTAILARNNRVDSCDTEVTSKTYLNVHPLFQSQSPEMVSSFRSDRVHIREDGYHGTVQFVLFGSKSTQDDELARYFFPDGKTSLIVDENFATDSDLFAKHFNIFTNNGDFRSRISIEPSYSVIGLGTHYRQSFWRDEDKDRAFWFSVSTPITRVKTDLNFDEKVLDDGDGPDEDANENVVANMKEAFIQKEWMFGKIDSKDSMTKTTLADIELKLGYEWLQTDPCHIESYIGFVIPSGNKPDGEFLFEPVVGRGKHWGVMFGSAYGIEVWKNEEENKNIRIEYNMHSEYLFEKEHIRSFDLKNKPWSRYMEVYANEDQAREASALTDPAKSQNIATPGINVFTQKVDVRPRFSYNINTAFVYTSVYASKGFQGEAGYNFFARQSECVKLSKPWKEGPALKHTLGAGQTNPIRDITGNPLLEQTVVNIGGTEELVPVKLKNYQDSIIKEEDLDLQSAATPCLLSHTFYGALGYRWDDREYPLFINYGASYTFSRSNNAVVQKWAIWGKYSFSF